MRKYVIPAKRKKSTKNKRWKKSRSRSRNAQPIKPHLINKTAKHVKTAKYIPPHKRNKTMKKKFKGRNKKKNWTNDWNINTMLEMTDDKPKKPIGLPNWPPKGPSPSELPPPVFPSPMKPHNSPLSPVKFTDEDMDVIKTVLEDAFKPSPQKPVLLRPQDLMKSKINTNLLTPAMIKSKNLARGTKKKKKRKHRKSKKKKTKTKRKKRKKH